MGTTSSITMQSLGKIAQCAPAVGAKMWCLPAGCREAANCRYCFSCFFFCHAPSPEHRVFEGYSSNKRCVAVYCPISTRFSAFFFHNGLFFQMHYIVLIFVASWCHSFREIAVKNCEKSQNWRKSLCAPLRIDS